MGVRTSVERPPGAGSGSEFSERIAQPLKSAGVDSEDVRLGRTKVLRDCFERAVTTVIEESRRLGDHGREEPRSPPERAR